MCWHYFFIIEVDYNENNLNPLPNKPWFLRVCSISLMKTLWEKEKLLVTSNFSFSHIVFYPFGELSAIFIKFEIVVWRLSVLKSLKFVVWKRVKMVLMLSKVYSHKVRGELLTLYHSEVSTTLGCKSFGTLPEKEKMLVTIIFSFSCNIFCPNKYSFTLLSTYAFNYLPRLSIYSGPKFWCLIKK